MPSITQHLSGEHRACDHTFAAAEARAAEGDLVASRDLFEEFFEAMERHFRREESVLFPEFEARTGQTQGPTLIMRHEHEQMRRVFQDLATAFDAGDAGQILGLAETLLILMQQHNTKEEQMLYPMSDQALADRLDTLLEAMQRP